MKAKKKGKQSKQPWEGAKITCEHCQAKFELRANRCSPVVEEYDRDHKTGEFFLVECSVRCPKCREITAFNYP